MKTKLLLSFVALFAVNVSIFAQAPDGLTCETAIPVDKSFEGTIPAAGTYYYSASTYDLPLTCYFYPEESIRQAPEIYVDFTCQPGVYEDPNLQEMIFSAAGWGIETPIYFPFNRSLDDEGREVYILSIDESYRELMSLFYITYEVDAIVKVVAPSAGTVMLSPDTTFKSCVENSTWLKLPSTVATVANFESEPYVLPLSEWKNDSIQFLWTGTNTPVSVWIGKECDFKLTTTGDSAAIAQFVLEPNAGNDEHIYSMTKQEVNDFISQHGLGGIYYLKVVAAEAAELIVEKKPLSPEMQKAIPLQLDQAVPVNVDDQVYYFPINWGNYSMYWDFATMANVIAYFSNNVTFEAGSDDPSVFATYQVPLVGDRRELKLSSNQMYSICSNANGDHVFVKFIAKQPTTFTPSLWSAGYCAENTNELYLNQMTSLKGNSTSTAWRVNMEQWAQQDVKLYWNGNGSIKIFLGDTCKGYTLSKDNQHVKYYGEVTVATNGSRDTLTITKSELENLVQYADGDSYLYFRFNNRNTGNLEVLAEVPEPVIPTPTSPCVTNSIELKANVPLTLNLDSAFTVYRINYSEWVTTGATLTWNGTEPLHTFVAETCEFAVAPYNKFVHAYVSVPAEGSAVLDAAKLAEMAAYVDEDGYLYIRFLTEKEGILEVK